MCAVLSLLRADTPMCPTAEYMLTHKYKKSPIPSRNMLITFHPADFDARPQEIGTQVSGSSRLSLSK